MIEQCNEIETFQYTYDSFDLHKKVKEATGVYKPRKLVRIVNKDGRLVIDMEEKKENLKELCRGNI